MVLIPAAIAIDNIRISPADQPVITGATVQFVISKLAEEDIIAVPAKNGVAIILIVL